MPPQQPDIAAQDEDEEGGGIDFDRIKQIAGFFIRAPRRRPKIAIATLVVGFAVVAFLAAALPRTYTVDMRFFAQRNLILPALDNPGRAIPQEAGNLTRGVADTLTRRDNMFELAREVDLLPRWKAARPGVLRFKDSLLASVFGAASDEDLLRGLIATLEQRLEVKADDSSVTITLDWAEKQMAFDLVSTLGKNFVEARYDSEIAVINEAIDILDQRAKEQGSDVDTALAEVVKIEASRRAQQAALLGSPLSTAPRVAMPVRSGGGGVASAPRAAPAAVAPAATNDESSDDAARLAEVRRSLSALEADQKRKVSDAQAQLDEARVTLGPMHPTVVALSQKIDQLKQPSGEMASLRAEERQILSRLSTYSRSDPGTIAGAMAPLRIPAAGGGGGGGGGAARPSPEPSAAASASALLPMGADDTQLATARSKLATETARYDELLRRIESAQIELDVARASFKYQYIIVRPPELPTKPRKPNVPALVIGGVLATILLALGLAGIGDLMSGRLLEPWQVQHRLKLEILGELMPPKS
jgi:hypothetical protein